MVVELDQPDEAVGADYESEDVPLKQDADPSPHFCDAVQVFLLNGDPHDVGWHLTFPLPLNQLFEVDPRSCDRIAVVFLSEMARIIGRVDKSIRVFRFSHCLPISPFVGFDAPSGYVPLPLLLRT